MSITGLHHVTLVTADARRNVDVYTRVLGLRLVKTTVNFDDPSRYHLYYADAAGTPGSVITFFEWPRAARGRPGVGGTHHVALRTADRDALLRWKRRLTDLGVRVRGPYDRHDFTSIYFRDPDGTILEIATDGPGLHVDEPDGVPGAGQHAPPAELVRGVRDEAVIAADTWPEPVPAIDAAMALTRGMHHISATARDLGRTDAFLRGVLGLSLVKRTGNFDDPSMPHWTWGSGDARPGTLVTYFGVDDPAARRAVMGAGQTHHYALAVDTDEAQGVLRERLLHAGLPVSTVQDRVYFRSIYTRDPDGHIVEVATAIPGFLVDEPIETTGRALRLPPWLERHREEIAAGLTPISAPAWPHDGRDAEPAHAARVGDAPALVEAGA
jgi:glyoxalase family protein